MEAEPRESKGRKVRTRRGGRGGTGLPADRRADALRRASASSSNRSMGTGRTFYGTVTQANLGEMGRLFLDACSRLPSW